MNKGLRPTHCALSSHPRPVPDASPMAPRLDFSPEGWTIAAIAPTLVPRPLSSPARSLLRTAVALGTLLAASPARAQSTGYPVRGAVVDAVSGQPLGRALVELNQDFALLTGNDGQFSFDNVPAGHYQVTVVKPGYFGFGYGAAMMIHPGSGIPAQPRPPRSITVGPDMAPLTFRITPLAMITGQVTLSTSDPADGIEVMAYTQRMQNGRLHWTLVGSARTRSDGSFRIDALSPGSYLIYSQPSLDRDGPTRPRAPAFGFPAVYYPGVTDPSSAGLIALHAGQHAEADISLVRQPFFPVTAVVRTPDSQPFVSFTVLDASGRQTRLSASYDRQTQTVTASVPNGSWSLEAHSYGSDMLWGRTDFQVAGAPVSFAISLDPVPHIPVNIRRDFTASADNSQPVQSSGPGMNLFLSSADDFSMFPYGGGLNSVEGSQGRQWELRILEPGRYWVQAQPFPPAYISSISSGGVDLAANPLIIVPGTDPAPIDITLRNDGGTITGEIPSLSQTLTGGASAGVQQPQVWIYAIPLFPTASDLSTGFLRPDGAFTIAGLAPGSYQVIACDTPQEDIDFHSAAGLAAWAGKGQTVTLDPGGSAHVDLTVVSTEGASE